MSTAIEASDFELVDPNADFTTAMSEAALGIEDFEQPEGPKSFDFTDSRQRNWYRFILNADGPEAHKGIGTSGNDATRFQYRMSWNSLTYNLGKARPDVLAPADMLSHLTPMGVATESGLIPWTWQPYDVSPSRALVPFFLGMNTTLSTLLWDKTTLHQL